MNTGNIDMKAHVVNILEGYSKRERQIALLHYEMQHTAHVLPDEVIDMMSLGHSDGTGSSGKGHISDKTMYIALNYQEKMDRMNAEAVNEIAKRLLELEAEQDRLRYYVSLLEEREAQVLRRTYFEGRSWEAAARELKVALRTVHKIKNRAIGHLADLYAYTDGLNR